MDYLVEDLLRSVKRLNAECTERVKFEEQLITTINKEDEELKTFKETLADLQDKADKSSKVSDTAIETCKLLLHKCVEHSEEIARLKAAKKDLEEEIKEFKLQVESRFLKPNEVVVWSNGVLEIVGKY